MKWSESFTTGGKGTCDLMRSGLLEEALSSFDTKTGCHICGQAGKENFLFHSSVFYPTEGHFDIYSCRECRVAYTVSRSAIRQDNLYEDFRGHNGQRFFGIMEWLIHLSEKNRARQIIATEKRGRILDVGCGRGLLLYYLKKAGWEVMGTESSEKTCRHIEADLGVPMRSSDLHELCLPSESLDGVVLWHVLEHLEDPVATLQEGRRILKEEGFLIIALPNFESIQSRCFKGRWFHLNSLYHKSHFSFSSLSALAEKNGFHIRKTRHFFFCHNVYGWLQSLLNLFFKEQDFLFYALQRSACSKNTKGFFRKMAGALCLSIFFLIPSLLLALWESMLKQGGTMELWLEKRHVRSE